MRERERERAFLVRRVLVCVGREEVHVVEQRCLRDVLEEAAVVAPLEALGVDQGADVRELDKKLFRLRLLLEGFHQ